MQIVIKKISEIKPYEKNPRNNKKAVEAVAESIKKFGFKVPVVIDSSGVIAAGHTRYQACKKLGIEDIPCIIADDLTEEQVKAFRLADNKTAEFSEWNFDLLSEELDGILNIDMSDFGFAKNENINFFDFINNEEFINFEKDKKNFGFTLQFEVEYKPYFDLYVKKFGKSKLVDILKKEVCGNA